MRSDYSSGFLKDMAPMLGEHYVKWLPYCREAVRATALEMKDPEVLANALGIPVTDEVLEGLSSAWFSPLLAYLERSGKLLRPYLVCLCLEAYGKDPREWRRQVALAELIHSSSLILDDVSDDSLFRRGAPSAHQLFGMRVAGASALAWLNLGFHLAWLDREALGEQSTHALIEALSWEHFVTGVGTTIDVTWAWRRHERRLPSQYLQQVVHRSTSYTYRLPLKIGAITGGAPKADAERLAAFGEELGLAFQLVDDILNIKPDDPHWGKETAEDIVQGKRSLQVLYALERLEGARRRRLLEILDSRTHDPEVLREAVALIESTGALWDSMALAQKFRTHCDDILQGLSLAPIHRERLGALAEYVVRRAR